MDVAFDLLLNLNCSKLVQEQIVNELKTIHSPWKIECGEEEEEQENENVDPNPQTCIDLTSKGEEEEDLAEIDKLLNKAQLVINRYENPESQKPTKKPGSTVTALKKHPSTNELLTKPDQQMNKSNVPVKPKVITQSSSSASLLNSKKKTAVFMNAPYRTEQPNAFKRSKSNSIIRPASSSYQMTPPLLPPQPLMNEKISRESQQTSNRDNFKTSMDLLSFREPIEKPRIAAALDVEVLSRIQKLQLVKKQGQVPSNTTKAIKFKEIAPTLSLPLRLSNLINSNLKLNISIENEMRKKETRVDRPSNPFISRLTQTFTENNNLNLAANSSLVKTIVANKKARTILDKYEFYLNYNKNEFEKLSKDEQFLKLFKLKILIKNAEKFNKSVQEAGPLELPSLREEKTLSNSWCRDLSLIDCLSLYESIKSKARPSCLVFYEKPSELKRLIDVECDLAELKFKMVVMEYLMKNFLAVLKANEAMKNEPSHKELINTLFNFILEKRTVIVKQN